jgi:uncharacterized RDD family membrane protein YckC
LCLAAGIDGILLAAAWEAALVASGSTSTLSRMTEPLDLDPDESLADVLRRVRAEGRDPETQAVARRDSLVLAMVATPLLAWAASEGGLTPGRRLTGIRLERYDGSPVTAGRAFVRDATPPVRFILIAALARRVRPDDQVVSALAQVGVVAAGLPVVLLDRHRRTLGDWIAGCRLVQR